MIEEDIPSCSSSASDASETAHAEECFGDDEEEFDLEDKELGKRQLMLMFHTFVVVCCTACFALDGTPGHVTA